MTYFINNHPTPILNTPHFSAVFGETLPFDEQNLIRAIEMVALPHTNFKVVGEKGGAILEVETEEYPSAISLYIDSRSGTFQSQPCFRQKHLPSVEEMIEAMKKSVGLPYVWGGNYSRGIPEWKALYPPRKELSVLEEAHWTFRGVDCSGLLYEAADGFTPRNTSGLMCFGTEVSLERMQPLDLILFPGHVMVAIGGDEVIESSLADGGVVIHTVDHALSKINVPFTLRRFHPTFL